VYLSYTKTISIIPIKKRGVIPKLVTLRLSIIKPRITTAIYIGIFLTRMRNAAPIKNIKGKLTIVVSKTYALLATTKPDKEVIAVLVDDNDSSNDNSNTGEFQDYVNKIYKYWTYFNTAMYSFSGSSDTGFHDPSSNAADTGGDGNGYQTNPTRAYSDNASFATDVSSGNGNGKAVLEQIKIDINIMIMILRYLLGQM
jgi:hypothetical protein